MKRNKIRNMSANLHQARRESWAPPRSNLSNDLLLKKKKRIMKKKMKLRMIMKMLIEITFELL